MRTGDLPRWKLISRVGILVGIALLLAAFAVGDIRSLAFEERDYVSKALAIAGALVTLGCLALNYELVVRLLAHRRSLAGANLVLLIVLSVALTGFVCYIGTRRFARIDMTGSRRHSLHSKTRRMLAGLDKDIKVTIVYQPPIDFQTAAVMSMTKEKSSDMLDEFRSLNRRITVEEINPIVQNEEAQDLLRRLGERNLPGMCVVFEAADSHDVIPLEKAVGLPRWQGEIPKFLGEAAFAGALAKLMDREKSVVYVMTGHGERPLEGQKPGPSTDRLESLLNSEEYSLSKVVKRLQQDNMEVKSLSLTVEGGIPDDCSALLVPGPTATLADREIDAIRNYLDTRDGRALVMLDSVHTWGTKQPNEKLSELLSEYGIRVRQDAAGMVELELRLGGVSVGKTTDGSVPVASEGYAAHPITSDLANFQVNLLSLPCTFEIVTPQPRPLLMARALLTGISSSWGETDLSGNLEDAKFDPGVDVAGPVTVGVVVEPGMPRNPYAPPPPSPPDLPGPRLVVLGSSISFINAAVDQNAPNLYLLQNAVNWLVGKRHMLGIPPKDLEFRHVSISQGQAAASLWLLVGAVPGAIVVLGVVVWRIRKR